MVALCGHDLIVVSAKRKPRGRPGAEMVSRRDGAADTLGPTDGPILVKGLGAYDGGGIDARAEVDVVGAAIGRHGAFEGTAGSGVVRAVRLHDVVLDKGSSSPTVDGQVTVAVGRVRARIRDGSGLAVLVGLLRGARSIGGEAETYLLPPGCQPFPPTQFPFPDQLKEYWPSAPFVYVASPPLSVQKE